MKKYQPYVPKEECVSLPTGWNEDDPTGMDIARLAEQGHSFDFLLEEAEDIYRKEQQ